MKTINDKEPVVGQIRTEVSCTTEGLLIFTKSVFEDFIVVVT